MKRILALLLCALLLLPALTLGEEEAPRRVVYLTFDDGPKKDTPELLALLEELDVPATFFFIGYSIRAFPEYAKMVVDAGYPVGCHTMSHSYKRLKESTTYMERDIERFIELMRETTDPEFTTDLYRFPGGSSSYARKNKEFVRNLGYAWFDWNAMNGDAHYSFKKDQEMIDYTIKTSGQEDVIILLMHEGKVRTKRTLPAIVQYYRDNGYEFRVLSTSEEEREILMNCPARMMLPDVMDAKEGE